MSRQLEFYFDFSSPFAYLASTQIEALAARTGAGLEWRPMLLGGVFKALGTPNVPLNTMSPARRSMYLKDMHRWAEHWDVPFGFPSRFPMNTVQALRCYLAIGLGVAGEGGQAARDFAHAVFRAYWAEDRDISDPGELAVLLSAAGHDPEPVITWSRSDAAKDALRIATSRALEAGVFGAPTCVVDGRHLFWGQDRLGMVERALEGWEPPV